MIEIPGKINAAEAAFRSTLNVDVLAGIFREIRAECNKEEGFKQRYITVTHPGITRNEVKYLQDLRYTVSDYFDDKEKRRIYRIEW